MIGASIFLHGVSAALFAACSVLNAIDGDWVLTAMWGVAASCMAACAILAFKVGRIRRGMT